MLLNVLDKKYINEACIKYQHVAYHRYVLRNVPDPNGSNRKIIFILEKGRVIYLEDKDDLWEIIALWEKEKWCNLLFALSVFFHALSLLLWWCLVMETKAFKEELSGYLGHLIADAEKFARSDFCSVLVKSGTLLRSFFGRCNCTCKIKIYRIL